MHYEEDMMVAEDGQEEMIIEEPKKETNWLKTKDPSHLCQYVHDTFQSIPSKDRWGNSHSQYIQTLGRIRNLEKAISTGLASDFHGVITEPQIAWLDEVRHKLHMMADELIDRTEAINSARDNHVKTIRQRHKKRAFDQNKCGICTNVLYEDKDIGLPLCLSCLENRGITNKGITKEATTPRIQLVMSPFERSIAGTLINATVSGGQNINEVYEKLKKKYGFDNREELGIVQLLADLGYPIIKDRVLMDDKEGSGEWIKNYHA